MAYWGRRLIWGWVDDDDDIYLGPARHGRKKPVTLRSPEGYGDVLCLGFMYIV